MIGGFIRTKISAPRVRKGLVQRQELFRKLDAGLDRKLTVISAPAGYGKTTLAASWLSSARSVPKSPQPGSCWFSLDMEDNDPVRFATYLTAALGSTDQSLGEELRGLLQASQSLAMQVFVTAMIDAVFRLEKEFIVVLDDYHLIVNKQIHEGLAFLLEHQPPQLHLLILTREDPPLPLSRMRARRELTEIRFEKLRFSREDAEVFLVDVMGLALTEHEIAALEIRTEGWITGLQLAALSIRGRDDVADFVESFSGSHRYILDFLVDEVFMRQSDSMQDFLLQTAVLDRLTAPLCNSVTGRSDSQDILMEAEQANLFFVALDDSREWFRFHQLFADLLRERLRRSSYSADLLHRHASRWYEDNNYVREAIKHALAGNNMDRAALLMESISEELLRRGQVTTLIGWRQALTDEIIYGRPKLCLEFAWAFGLARRVDEADCLLEPILAIAADVPDLLGEVLILQAHIARTRHDIPGTITLSQKARELIPAEDINARGILGINLGVAYMYNGDLAEAKAVLEEAAQDLQKAENYHGAVMALGFVGQIKAIYGRLHEAAAIQRRTIQIGMENMAQPATGRAHVNLAAILYEWNELDAAANHLQQARKLSRRTGDAAVEWDACRVLAKVHQATGDDLDAIEVMGLANEAARNGDAPANARLANVLVHMQLALQQKDLALAESLARDIYELAPQLPVMRYDLLVNAGSLTAIPGIVWALFLIEQERFQEAAELLAACYDEARYPYDQISTRLALARASADEEVALDTVIAAISQAQGEGYVRSFVDSGAALAPLLGSTKVTKLCLDFVEELGRSFAVEENSYQSSGGSQPLIEPLSERELEILQLLAKRQTNAEIAQAITVSVNTVKTHLQHIYEKLGVHDRRTAVAKAEDLRLLH